MSFVEKFLKKNCAKQTKISSYGEEIYYTGGTWNSCYGNVVIEPKKSPNAQYKWTIVPQCKESKSLIMAIGIINTGNNRNYNDTFWCKETSPRNPAYYYYSNGWTRATTINERHSKNNPYQSGDIITMDVNIKTKKITFQKNNQHVDTMDIDISKTYVFAVSLSGCGIKLNHFEHNLGNVEQKQNETWQSNLILKHELIALADKMNAFYIKYDENMLCNMYNNNPDSLFVEQDIDNVSLICHSLEKRLGEMKNYVISVTKPNVNEYKLWDINTMILWIKSLDNGHFIKYCDILRKGFEGDCVSADDLPNIGQSDLATTPFDIRVFKDRKRLAQHFKSLEQNQVANTMVNNLNNN